MKYDFDIDRIDDPRNGKVRITKNCIMRGFPKLEKGTIGCFSQDVNQSLVDQKMAVWLEEPIEEVLEDIKPKPKKRGRPKKNTK